MKQAAEGQAADARQQLAAKDRWVGGFGWLVEVEGCVRGMAALFEEQTSWPYVCLLHMS